ncbi:MAG TPA: phosphate ABC transporter substrate-binding protein [Ktedonobacterales bacterium]
MSDRSQAIRTLSSLGAKAAFGAIVVSSLIVAACGTTSGTGSTTTGNASLQACTVAATDLAPKTTSAGTATAVSGLSGQKLAVDGSSALQPLFKQAAAEFDKANGSITTVSAGGSGQGLKDVAAGAVQIGMSDVFASAKLAPDVAATLTDHQVGAVVFTLVVNNDLNGKVNNLTTQEIQDIFSGKTTNWSQIGGPSEAVTVVNRPTTSGTRSTFDKYVLKGVQEAGGTTLTQDNTGAVAQAVSQTPGSIGYVSIGFAASAQYNTQLTPICIDGSKAVAADVNSGAYNFWGIEHAYTKGAATGVAKALIQYVESSQVQTNDLPSLSYLPISAVSATAVTAHTPSGAPAAESFYQ